ncbi:MAG: multidrug ABC transporter ATPase [Microbacteriaceae bacterium]
MADKPPVNINRSERVLAYMILSTIAVSIIAVFTALIGIGAGADGSSGLWPVIVILPSIGFPIAFALIVALVITSAVRRGRAARNGSQ